MRELFMLCGGHISPIHIEAKKAGIPITEMRDEATAVFAADAHARLIVIPGVAAVTAGPGLTNTITVVKNAQLVPSPLLVRGGATAMTLKNRGALQDIEQKPLMRPHVKHARAVRRLRDLAPAVAEGLRAAESGVPGPAFVECPVDLLYDEAAVCSWCADSTPKGSQCWSTCTWRDGVSRGSVVDLTVLGSSASRSVNIVRSNLKQVAGLARAGQERPQDDRVRHFLDRLKLG